MSCNEVTDIQPTSLSHLIGQRNVIEQVLVAIDAAQQDGKRFDHSLLVGPPGLGKSALAAVIAHEMATDFHEVLGQSLNNVGELNGLLLAAREKDVVLIDECHELKKESQTALYLALDKQAVFVKGGSASPQRIPISKFSLAFGDHGRVLHFAAASRPHEAPAALRVLLRRRIGADSSPS